MSDSKPPFVFKVGEHAQHLINEMRAIDPHLERRQEPITWDSDEASAQRVLESHAGLQSNEHGEATPKRFLAMLDELTGCRDCDGVCMKWKDFPAENQDLICIQRIPFYSVCNHHVIPFVGFVHIAYIPEERMAGLSKFARTVHHFARQLQTQERLTFQVAEFLKERLGTQSVGVIVKAEHMCMTIRGVQAPGTYTTTAHMAGSFADHSKSAKMEFLSYVNGNGHG